MTDAEEKFLTLKDVSELTQLSLRTVRDHEKKRILEADRLGRRVRVSPDQYRAYVANLREMGRPLPPAPGRDRAEEINRQAARDALKEMAADGSLTRLLVKTMEPEIRKMIAEKKAAGTREDSI